MQPAIFFSAGVGVQCTIAGRGEVKLLRYRIGFSIALSIELYTLIDLS